MAATIVWALLVTVPSPRPVRPSWSVCTLTNTQFPPPVSPTATTNVCKPVIFIPVLALLTVSRSQLRG